MKYKNYNDYELIYHVREDDENSRSIIYEKYVPLLQNIAYSFYKDYKHYGYDYDDFYQEALISFQEALVKYDESKDTLFYTFVNVCVKRSLITFCRNISIGKQTISNKYLIDIDDVSLTDKSDDIDNIFSYLEMEKLCKKVIFELPWEAGVILELKLNGFTYQEIGILLDIPVSSVEYKSRNARRYIRRIFRKYCENS